MQKIAAKLVKVMQECSCVKKNGINDFHHYNYATSADVLEKINAALTKYGLISVAMPELVNMQDIITNKGNTEHLATVRMEIILVDSESGETVTITGIGSGQDPTDKAVMKAQTAAIKYAYLLSMAISTGDDPEAESQRDSISDSNIRKDVVKANESVCSNCGIALSKGVIAVSTKKYGKPLCLKCQKKLGNAA